MKKLLAIFLLLALPGCATSNRPSNGVELTAKERFFYRSHVSDLETEAKVRGKTNDTGPRPWGGVVSAR